MFCRAMPPASSLRSNGGSTTGLGAGRVMSHTEIAADFFPAITAASGGPAAGASSAASIAPTASASGAADFQLSTWHRNRSGIVTVRPSFPNASRVSTP